MRGRNTEVRLVEIVGTERRASCDFPAKSTVASDNMAGKGGNSGVTRLIGRFLGFGRCFMLAIVGNNNKAISKRYMG